MVSARTEHIRRHVIDTREKNDARLARAILRVVQNQPGIRRTFLTTQIRAYGDNAYDVLDSLIANGLIIETPKIIRVKSKNRRAALTYRLSEREDWPEFDDIDYVATSAWLSDLNMVVGLQEAQTASA